MGTAQVQSDHPDRPDHPDDQPDRAAITDHTAARDTLGLTLVPGLGPVRIAALLERFGSAAAVLRAPREAIATVRGVGPTTARAIADARPGLDARIDEELAVVSDYGAHVLVRGGPGYPPLLEPLPDAPPLLFVRGRLEFDGPIDRSAANDQTPVGIVGSRRCTPQGAEQSARFASALARAGVTVVSGGAAGIDTAAHRGALEAGGRTLAVLGCGLCKAYPPENAALFDRIAAEDLGAVISELPMRTAPVAANFPARNRIISGLSLGVLVVQAAKRSGALITARLAAEEHGREVMAIPGRLSDPESVGALELIKMGGATLVTEPSDVLSQIAEGARFVGSGLISDRLTPDVVPKQAAAASTELLQPAFQALQGFQAEVVAAIGEGAGFDDILASVESDAGKLRSELTMLEIAGLILRDGPLFRRR